MVICSDNENNVLGLSINSQRKRQDDTNDLKSVFAVIILGLGLFSGIKHYQMLALHKILFAQILFVSYLSPYCTNKQITEDTINCWDTRINLAQRRVWAHDSGS